MDHQFECPICRERYKKVFGLSRHMEAKHASNYKSANLSTPEENNFAEEHNMDFVMNDSIDNNNMDDIAPDQTSKGFVLLICQGLN